MHSALATETLERDEPTRTVVDIVVPVYNEEATVGPSVRRLRRFLDRSFPFPAVVTIVDNGSVDRTAEAARRLADDLPGVRFVHLNEKGRGRALRTAWMTSTAEVVAYMDVDLSTSLDALHPLVAPLLSGHSDVAIGSRLVRGARVVRGPKREMISRAYNLVLKATLHNGFSDAQCGFKALRNETARRLLPMISDNEWFFDTELLVVAERSGLRIHEVPVDWVDDPDSRVNIAKTAAADLRGVARLLTRRSAEPAGDDTAEPGDELSTSLGRFARVGVASTFAYLALFLALRGSLGGYGANTLALVLCTAANAVANRRFTFAGRRPARWRDLIFGGAAILTTSLSLTTAAVAVVELLGTTSAGTEVVALVAANGAAALVRFLVLRAWIFRSELVAAGGRATP